MSVEAYMHVKVLNNDRKNINGAYLTKITMAKESGYISVIIRNLLADIRQP